jgi:hypothetical protein
MGELVDQFDGGQDTGSLNQIRVRWKGRRFKKLRNHRKVAGL